MTETQKAARIHRFVQSCGNTAGWESGSSASLNRVAAVVQNTTEVQVGAVSQRLRLRSDHCSNSMKEEKE